MTCEIWYYKCNYLLYDNSMIDCLFNSIYEKLVTFAPPLTTESVAESIDVAPSFATGEYAHYCMHACAEYTVSQKKWVKC